MFILLAKADRKIIFFLIIFSFRQKRQHSYRIDRGGDITYHGPGQIVGYPIFDLDAIKIGLKEYIYRLEEAIIRTVGEFGINGFKT